MRAISTPVTIVGCFLAARGASSSTIARSISTSRAVVTSSVLTATSFEVDTWTLSGSNPSSGDISVPASVPGNAHLALMAAGVLDIDPLYRTQETNYSWVAETNWTYTSTFPTPADVADFRARGSSPSQVASACFLVLDGVDTVATISLNGVALGFVNNLFKVHRFDVSMILAAAGQDNTLVVSFQNALDYALRMSEAYPYEVPETANYNVWAEPSHRNFVRKVGNDFGWDWGPAFVPTGIVGGVSLEVSEGARLHGVTVEQHHKTNGKVLLKVNALLERLEAGRGFGGGAGFEVAVVATLMGRGAGADGSGRATHARSEAMAPFVGQSADSAGGADDEYADDAPPAQAAAAAASRRPANDGARRKSVSLALEVAAPALWWPAGYGEARLYDLKVTVHVRGGRLGLGQVAIRRVGLRTVELVEEPLPRGLSFYFKINGVPVFAKGSNFIPADVFSPRVTEEYLDEVLQAAVDANQNMVRVWGGGTYQSDAFYDLADEKGLMLWQETMFACALYPRDATFLQLVADEITEQVTRMQSHPAIVIWGGNNEDETALNWFDASNANMNLYVADYAKLYLDTIKPAIEAVDGTVAFGGGVGRAFVDSSPSNGILSGTDELFVKRWNNSGSPDFGDVHYYNYAADCEDWTTYPKARFVSEHGFQSFPSLDSYSAVLAPEDMNRDSAVLAFRQRHENGNDEVMAMASRHFSIPAATSPDPAEQQELFDEYCWLTQVQQARCYETAFTTWRRYKGVEAVKTMGVLYWQLNDVWQGPTWSSLELGGRWKAVHYAVKNAFAPLLVSGYVDGPDAKVALTSDVNADLAVNVTVEILRWDQAAAAAPAVAPPRVHSQAAVYQVEALQSLTVLSEPLDQLLAGCAPADCFVRLSATSAPTAPPNAGFTSRSYIFPTTFKVASLPAAVAKVSGVTLVDADGDGRAASATLTVTADNTAAFVTVGTASAVLPGRFSDNAIFVLPGEPQTLTFFARKGTTFTAAELEATLTVRNLAANP